MRKPDIDSDIRSEIINALTLLREEQAPAFPDRYSCIIYTALGTIKLMHEAVEHANKSRPKDARLTLSHLDALANVIALLQELGDEPSPIYTGNMQ